MKTLYLDLFSGISGDMFIGALVDLGLDPEHLQHELEKLNLHGYHLHFARSHKGSIEGVKFDVHVSDHDHVHDHAGPGASQHALERTHPHSHSHGGKSDPHTHTHEHERTFSEIKQLILSSQLSPWVKEKAVAVFKRVAVAE